MEQKENLLNNIVRITSQALIDIYEGDVERHDIRSILQDIRRDSIMALKLVESENAATRQASKK